jgi:GT2 family glycosyltransferase
MYCLHVLIGDDAYYKSAGLEIPSRGAYSVIKYGDTEKSIARRKHFKKNLHFGGNVNRCCNHMMTDVMHRLKTLVICNSDIIFTEGAIDTLVETSQKYNALVGPAVIVPPAYVSDEHGPHMQMFSPRGYAVRERHINSTLESATAISGCCFAVPAGWWRDVGGFDSDNFKAYFEDDDISIRANISGLPVLVNYNALVRHEVNQSIEEAEFNKNKTIQESKKAFEAKWPEITWDPTGKYHIPEIDPNDRRTKRSFRAEELAGQRS